MSCEISLKTNRGSEKSTSGDPPCIDAKFRWPALSNHNPGRPVEEPDGETNARNAVWPALLITGGATGVKRLPCDVPGAVWPGTPTTRTGTGSLAARALPTHTTA